MFNPKVSIIIPVYNGSNYLKEAIESALNQTYKNIEILVINDGSTDKGATEKIALSFGNKIKYIKKENGGVSTALNLGIKKSSGKYISWLSHDDEYYPNKIEKQVQKLCNIKNKNSIVYGNIDIINGRGDITKKSIIPLKNITEENFLYYLVTKHIINGCSLLIPKDILNKVGLFNIDLKTVQDYDMWFKLFGKINFIKVNFSLVQSRQHIGQDSKNPEKFILMMKEEKKIYGNFINKIGINNIYKSYNGSILLFISDFFIKLYIKIKIILPIFIFIGKFNIGRKFISKIR